MKSKLNESEPSPNAESFLYRLKMCLLVQTKYKEAFRNLRDALGGTHALSSFPSVSSVNNFDPQSASNAGKKSSIAMSLHRNQLVSAVEQRNHGILMSDEDIIFEHIDTFSKRVRCLIEQITTMSQFQILLKNSSGLARPKKEDLGITDDEEKLNTVNNQSNQDTCDDDKKELVTDSSDLFSASKAILDIVLEENEEHNFFLNGQSHHDIQNSVEDVNGLEESAKTSNAYVANSNKKLIESAQKLFTTETRTEQDCKNLLKKAQTLSDEDIRLMSN